MYVNALICVLPDTSPEAKFLLVKSLYCFSFETWSPSGVHGLASHFGMATQTISKALKHFESQSYLLQTKKVNKVGPASIAYKWSDDLVFRLKPITKCKANLDSMSGALHSHVIEQLLNINSKGDKKRGQTLNTSNKLLLMVLLSFADACGVVSSLGASDLAKLTGMSKDRLGSQLSKLKMLGYIRLSVSGITDPKLFGLVKSIYVLNFKLLEGDSGNTLILNNLSEKSGGVVRNFEAVRICSLASACQFLEKLKQRHRYIDMMQSKPTISILHELNRLERLIAQANDSFPCDESFLRIASYFCGSPVQGWLNFLQMKLEGYASYLLSNNWEQLSTIQNRFEKLEQLIQGELGVHNFENANEKVLQLEDLHLLVSFIAGVSCSIAKRVHADLRQISELTVDAGTRFLILPDVFSGRLREYLVVEVFIGLRPTLRPKCLRMNSDGILVSQSEDEMPITDRFKYGLLAPYDHEESRVGDFRKK